MTTNHPTPESGGVSRRTFLTAGAAAATAFTVLPAHVLGRGGATAPNSRVNLGFIGVGGQGIVDMKAFLRIADAQVVSVCDVRRDADYSMFYFKGRGGWEPAKKIADDYYAEQSGQGSYDAVRTYTDYHEMLEKEAGIDAVVVATTDNLHAFAAMAAMRKEKHVYCEKPLTHDIWEARRLAETARELDLVTQMGNHGHAKEYIRLVVEWVRDGAIGDVREVICWTNRPVWPQGIPRPAEEPVPDGLDWDRWIGPAPFRPHNGIYAPFNWRGWWHFGTGALGDMGCHIMDAPIWALELGHPERIQASATPFEAGESCPSGSMVTYDFPARGAMPPVRLTWYDGGLMPPRPKELEADREMPGTGSLLLGDKGTILCEESGAGRLIPETAMQAYSRPEKTIPRTPTIYEDFIRGVLGGPAPCSNFSVSGPLTETVLAGNVAILAGKNVPIEWDWANLRVTNNDAANNHVRREYREGWTL